MRTVRLGTFETNSSSCHVVTLMSSADKENLLNRNALVYIDGHVGPDDDCLGQVLTYDEFVETFFRQMFENERYERRVLKRCEEPVKKILKQFWADFVTDVEHNKIEFHANTGNQYYEYRYTQMPEWKDIDALDHDVKFRIERKLRFTEPDYDPESLLEGAAELKLKHDTAYAVSWEKEY